MNTDPQRHGAIERDETGPRPVSGIVERIDVKRSSSAESLERTRPTANAPTRTATGPALSRRAMLAAVGVAAVGGPLAGRAVGAQTDLASILVSGLGRWYQEDLLDPQGALPGAPVARTNAIWQFQLEDSGLEQGFRGIGVRQSILVLPNGHVANSSGITGNVGGHFRWGLQGNVLHQRYDTWTGHRDAQIALEYLPDRDQFAVDSSEYGRGTWVRLEETTAFNEGRLGEGSAEQYQPYSGFQTVTDESGVIQMDVPVEWGDVVSRATELGPAMAVSPDNAAFERSLDVPGALVLATNQLQEAPETIASSNVSSDCTPVNATTFESATGLVGPMSLATACGGTPTSTVDWVGQSPDGGPLAVVKIRLATERDHQAAITLLESLRLAG